MSRLEALLRRWATWPVMTALALAAVLIPLVLFPLVMPAAPGTVAPAPLDTRLTYTQAEAQAGIAPLTPVQRSAVAWGHLTADVLYPLVYGLLLALLLLRAWPGRRFWPLALAVVLADLTENALLAALYWGYPERLGLVPFAAAATAAKWAMVGVTALLTLIGALRRPRTGITP